MVANMAETNTIVWLPPSKCTKRDAEIQSSLKEKPQTVTVEQHTLKLATRTAYASPQGRGGRRTRLSVGHAT